MTTKRNARTAEEWAEYLEARKPAVAALHEALRSGKDEVETARQLGFATRNDIAEVIYRRTGRWVDL